MDVVTICDEIITVDQVRTVVKDGEPWFVAKDVAEVLEFSETAQMTRHLDSEEVMSVKLTGMNMNSTLINEAGLYSVILRSRKPEAKQFKRWITHEVIPTIRKTGGYAAILKRKQQKIRRFDDYLYASFRQAAWTVKARENRVKNVGLLAEFETFLQA
ncbi:Bro-N domain-containing protein [Bacillus sp. LB7]|uniref:BRO-N domain-containing protein n=1 Tax=Bacillus sp. LB7 TaxID=3043238 RepID=UPI0026495F4D|nr:Bro-N domain-containing protein [Bacillus sp. LB7]MDN5388742.1 Bro-N domain-containing protein [Bacillus sp. LB7]